MTATLVRHEGFSIEDERAGRPIRWWCFWSFTDGFEFARGGLAADASACRRDLDHANERMNAEHRDYRIQEGLA